VAKIGVARAKRNNVMKRRVTGILLIFLLTGCAALEEVGPPRAFTLEEVRHYVGINSLKVNTLKARVEVIVESPELEAPLSCQGYLRLKRPRRLRVVCSKLFTTIFDIASDGQGFRLYVPEERKVYTGRADQHLTYLGLNFAPNDVADLLDFEEMLSSKRLLLEPAAEHWTLHVLDVGPTSDVPYLNLFIDKRTLQVVYVESFNPDGSLRMQATLGEYQTVGGSSLPRSLEIYWLAGDTHLTLGLSKIEINKELDPRVFQLSLPKGVETIKVTDGAVGPRATSQ
jgi:outer membrane lipoprotein-sorting protein